MAIRTPTLNLIYILEDTQPVVVELKAWDGYSLELTLAPSFVRALFAKTDGVWIKLAGWRRGARLWQEGTSVRGEKCGTLELACWSGVWFSPRLLERIPQSIVSAYRGISLSINPYDLDLMFVPIFLSRATSWETNVLKWCRKHFSKVKSWSGLLNYDFSAIGSSFQLKQLGEVVEEFDSKVLPHMGESIHEIRRRLLTVRHVGPKIADAYLLFTGLDISSAPVDRHLTKMMRRLELIPHFTLPEKRLCLQYECSECPKTHSCLRALMREQFGYAAGWLQTVMYLHDTLYCSKKACSECPLKAMCMEWKL